MIKKILKFVLKNKHIFTYALFSMSFIFLFIRNNFRTLGYGDTFYGLNTVDYLSNYSFSLWTNYNNAFGSTNILNSSFWVNILSLFNTLWFREFLLFFLVSFLSLYFIHKIFLLVSVKDSKNIIIFTLFTFFSNIIIFSIFSRLQFLLFGMVIDIIFFYTLINLNRELKLNKIIINSILIFLVVYFFNFFQLQASFILSFIIYSILYFIINLILKNKIYYKNYIKFIIIILFLLLPQLISFLMSSVSTLNIAVSSFSNYKEIFIANSNYFSTILNSFFLVFKVPLYLNFKANYLFLFILQTLLFIIILSSVLSFKKIAIVSRKRIILFLFLNLILFFIVKGAVGPFGFFVTNVMSSSSLLQILRDVYGKFSVIYLLNFSVLLYLSFNELTNKYKKIFIIPVAVSVLLGIYFLVGPGNVIQSDYIVYNLAGQAKDISKNIDIPNEYWDFRNIFEKQKIDSKNLLLPLSLYSHNVTYNWSDTVGGGDYSELIFNKSTFGSCLWEYGQYNEYCFSSNYMSYNLFSYLNINNIIIRKDINREDGNYLGKTMNDPKYFEHKLVNDGFEMIENNNRVSLFINNKYYLPHFYTPQTLITTSQGIETLPEIVSQSDYQIRSAIYFNKPNQASVAASPSTAISTSTSFNPDELKKETVSNTPVIEFKKINPTKYRVIIHHAKNNFPLIFSESFHDGWKTYLVADKKSTLNFNPADYKILDGNLDDQASFEELTKLINSGDISTLGNLKEQNIKHVKWENNREVFAYNEQYKIDFISKNFQDTIQNDNLAPGSFYETWFKKMVDDNQNHLMVNGYANSWNINPAELCGAPAGKALCVRNADGSYDLELVVEFWPQRLFYVGLFVSGMTLLGCLGYLGWDFAKRRKNKNTEDNRDVEK